MAELQLFNKIGSGSYGTVYLAKYEDKMYAAKIIPCEELDSTVRDAVFLKYLQGSCVVRVHLIGMLENGDIVILMERCFKVMKNQNIVNSLIFAINTIHEKYVLHRDISPNNIMCTPRGSLVLIDFGLSSFSCGFGCRDSLSCGVTTLTSCPEELVHAETSSYGYELDIFASGATAAWILGLETYKSGPTIEDYKEKVKIPLYSSIDSLTQPLRNIFRSLILFRKATVPKSQEPVYFYEDEQQSEVTYTHRILLSSLDDPINEEHDHRDYGTTLYTSFASLIRGSHGACIVGRTNKLSSLLCPGTNNHSCKDSAALAFTIVLSLHQRLTNSFLKNIFTWTSMKKVHFYLKVSEALVSAVHNVSWLEPCEINGFLQDRTSSSDICDQQET